MSDELEDLGSAEQRKNQAENMYMSLADQLLLQGLVTDNDIIMYAPNYEEGLPEKTGDRPGENIGAQDYLLPLVASFLGMGAIAAGPTVLAKLGGIPALQAAGRITGLSKTAFPFTSSLKAGATSTRNLGWVGNPWITVPATKLGWAAKKTYGVGVLGGAYAAASQLWGGIFGGTDKSPEELKVEAEKQLEEDLAGATTIGPTAEIPGMGEGDGGFGLADYSLLAEQAGLNQSNFRTQMPGFYGGITLTDKGMFASSEASDVAGAAILEGLGDKAELEQYLVPPLASSAGRTLGAMTVRWYDVYAPISEQAVQAGLGSVTQQGVGGPQGEFYSESKIGDEQIIGRSMLAPGEEMPEAPMGRRYEEREAEVAYGIDDALAYYDGLEEEEKREFATGLLALGYMGTGRSNDVGTVDWLLNPDSALQRDAVETALIGVANVQNAKMEAVYGKGRDATSISDTDPLKNRYLPMLDMEGGLFDNPKVDVDFSEFVKEAQQKAGYLRTVDTRYVAKATNDWAFRVYGRSATPDEQSAALNAASALAESLPVGPNAAGRLSDASLAVGAVGQLDINEAEAGQNNAALINNIIGNYIQRNSRGLVT
ncbi:MAG: hypothetical protein CMB22_00360 [Euryarchaeota archaeon]|nr:hypothetical protein [Euryarchaeota archaeon]|tara:strand:+ start:9795 stop:11588 length:1794 start_codon:yes stop_codon:yes gene_type:complete